MKKPLILARYLNRFGVAFTLSYLFQRLVLKKKILALKLQHLPHKVFLRNNHSDFQVFTQIFLNNEYQIDLSIKPETIVDCGANIGLATLFFLRHFPESNYIVIEPEKGNFEMLALNLNLYPNVKLLNKAIWNTKGYIVIKDNGWGEAGFIAQECSNDEADSIETISINDIFKDFNLKRVDLLKLDIEGSEEQVFSDSYEQWMSKTNMIFVEIHENLKPGLTARILELAVDDFQVSMNGEYYFLKRKIKC